MLVKPLPFFSVRLFWLAPVALVAMMGLTMLFGWSVPVARGKMTAVPLSAELSAPQRMAQQAALADVRVLDLTDGRRTEVFGVLDLRGEFTPNSVECATTTCYQVEIYDFDNNAAIAVIVNPTSGRVLDVLHRPGIQPGINKRLADLALHIAIHDPQVIDILGYKPLKANLSPVPAGMAGSVCDEGHLCAAPTFRVGDQLLWVMVDLTDENVAGLAWTELGEEVEQTAAPFVPTNCRPPGSVNRAGWSLEHSLTGGDGLRVHQVSFNGVSVANSIKVMEWHASYGGHGYVDSVGCGGGGGFQIFPYGDTQVLDLLDAEDSVIGFEVVQDFRMSSWGGFCNYRYDQRVQFYNDGRFRVVTGAFGKGCGNNATYRPVVRIDLDVVETGEQSFATWNGTTWQTQPSEFWQLQAAPYTPLQAKWRISHASGTGYYMEPGQGQFGDDGRGDNAYVYVTQHKPAEGDTDLGVMSSCCHNDHRQGPEAFIDGESIVNQNIVVWYVPQLVTDISPNRLYCWTVTGEPNPETYPCYGGPMFVPKAHHTFTGPDLVGTNQLVEFNSTATGVLPITYAWDFGDGMGTSNQSNPTYPFPMPGVFTVTLTTTGANGESFTSTQTVEVTGVLAGFDYLTPISLGETSLFTNTSISNPTAPFTYTWDFGDGSGSQDENPTYLYSQIGMYTVTLTVSNSVGMDTFSAVLQVGDAPTAVIDPLPVLGMGELVTFTHQSTGGTPLAFHWAFGDGQTSTDETPTYSYAEAGYYTVTLTVSNSWGIDMDSTVVTVDGSPTAALAPLWPTAVNHPITPTAHTTGQTPLVLAWDWGDGATSDGENPSHSYAATGIYTVTLTVSNSWGVATAETAVAVGDATAIISPTEGGQIGGESITITVPVSGTAELITLLYTQTDLDPNWPDYTYTGLSFNLSAYQAGTLLTPYQLLQPAQVVWDDAAWSLDPTSLLLLYWDGSAWGAAADGCASLPTQQKVASAVGICATGDYALVGLPFAPEQNHTQYLPLVIR